MSRQQGREQRYDQTTKRKRQERLQTGPKQEKEITQFVQDFIPIKDIKNGIIEMTDGRFIKILEIEPINFSLRSAAERNNIIYNFAGFLNIGNVKMQFKSITKKADTEKHIQLLKRDMETETNEKTKEMSKSYIQLVRDVGSKEALTRRFFLIFEYEPPNRGSKAYEYNEVFKILNNVAAAANSYLSQCGNAVIQPANEDQYLGEILYMFFNRRSSMSESFQQRVKRVMEDTMASKNRILGRDEVPAIPPVNYIAPRGLDLKHANYIIMDGMYYTYLYIKGKNGYPSNVYGGWISGLVNAGEGVDVDVHMRKETNRSLVLESISRKIRLNSVKARDISDTQTDFEEIRDAIRSAYYIKEGMNSGGQDLHYLSILITISAPTLSLLWDRKREVEDMVKAREFGVADCKFYQEQAFLSTMPINKLDKGIERKAKRNFLTYDAASTYMFTAFEMCDDNGILLGVNAANSSLCIIDIFNSKIYKNANMCILGTSGSGKTFTMQLIALRMRMRGIQVFIIAPLKGHEFKRACKNIGGTYVKISSGSPDSINVMEIRVPDTSARGILEEEEEPDNECLLVNKISQLNTFFSLMIPDMTNEEAQLLDEAIVECYARRGITHDNESVYIPGTKELREPPILGELYEILNESEYTRRLSIIVNKFVNGSAISFNRHTNVDMTNKYIVVDISKLDEKMLAGGMFIALDYIWDKAKEDCTQKKAIFIDETWKLIGANSNKYAANFVLEIFKIIRGYGGSAIAATQDLGDFFALEDGKYGKGIVNNSKTKILLNMEYDEVEFVKDKLKLSKSECRSIVNFKRGQALISANNNKVPVIVKPSPLEESLITTDRAQLAAQVEEKKAAALKKKKQEADRKLLKENE